jgi:hypothetical protein
MINAKTRNSAQGASQALQVRRFGYVGRQNTGSSIAVMHAHQVSVPASRELMSDIRRRGIYQQHFRLQKSDR